MRLSAFLLAGLLLAPQVWAGPPRYIGVERCENCHAEGAAPAVRYWRKGPHAGAYATLRSEKARQLAQQTGLSDPAEAPQCLACHTTAPQAPEEQRSSSYVQEEGVGCEACHGPGQKYSRFEVMSKAAMLRLRKPDRADRFGSRYGLKMPDEDDCRQCHGPSRRIGSVTYPNPTNRPFDYRRDLEAIRHWR